MSAAKAGDIVQVHYTGKFENGSVFDSSVKHDPIEVALGEHQVIRGFEEALIGMAPGETKTIKVPPEKGYGQRRQDLVVDFDRNKVPADLDVEVGKKLSVQGHGGQSRVAEVIDVTDDVIKLDANHPLAGRELTFDIQLVAITAEA
jgi:peptidylprolyl isomerase